MAAVMIAERPAPPRRRPEDRVRPDSARPRLVVVRAPAPAPRTTTRVSAATFRRRRLVALAGLVVAVAIVGRAGAALGSGSLAAPGRGPAVVRYVVRPGDTLWSAASHLAPGRDPREVVDGLVQSRGNGPLQPGEVLRWQR
jgi:nucleoid-associated protein YgaU